MIKDPETTPQQWAYITNYVQAFETALFSPNFTDPVNGYRRYLDVDSFIDHYLVQEITKNQDVFWSSTFFTKERGDDLLRFGPVWDFDRSMGSLKGVVDLGPEGFRARGRGPWSSRIFQDPTFVAQVAERWQELRPTFATLPDLIMAKGAELRPMTCPSGTTRGPRPWTRPTRRSSCGTGCSPAWPGSTRSTRRRPPEPGGGDAGQAAVPPMVRPLATRSVGTPSPTGTPWPSLPQVPGAPMAKSLPTASIEASTAGPLPMRLPSRNGSVMRPSSIR